MSENRNTVVQSFGPAQAGAAEALWVERDSGPEPVAGHGKRILLVEDQQPLRACLRLMLELEGHQVTEAGNGAEALNLFTLGEFDLVVTDFDMPVMNGSKLAIGIKLLAPLLPILMITASERAHRDAQNPVDELLRKPCTVAELHDALERLLSARPEPSREGTVSTPERVLAANGTALQA